ncbi:MAG: hypothetical protein RIE32_05950 [Phycisphaerales bacterium]
MRPLNQCRVFLGALSLAAMGGVAAGQVCTWSGLDGGASGGFGLSVQTLEVYDDGTR